MSYKKLTTEEFIERAKLIHGDIFDYTCSEYSGILYKIKIRCRKHGIFKQIANSHLTGSKCPLCNLETRTKTLITFIKEANLIYNNKFLYNKFVYKTSHTKGTIICNIGHEFEQSPASHLQGFGCPKCNVQNRAQRSKQTTKHFINKSKLVHDDIYEYDCSEYIGRNTKIKIRCKIHGIFEQFPGNHYAGYGCQICKSSHGEIIIQNFLNKKELIYQKGYIISKCKNKKTLPFDFAVFSCNILLFLIEYQGRQHYSASSFGSKKQTPEKMFEIIKVRDKIKKEYCENNKIPLLIIPYWDKDNIETIMDTYIREIDEKSKINNY
jgi:hypothetical protein